METLMRVAVGVAFEFFAYWIARILLPILTLGAVRAQQLGGDRQAFNWLGFRLDADRRIVCSTTTASTIGVMLLFVALGVLVARFGR